MDVSKAAMAAAATQESVVLACKGMLGYSREEYLALAGVAAACSMVGLGTLSLFDMSLSATLFTAFAQSVVLLAGGLACFEGEQSVRSELLHWRQQVAREYFGFAMTPVGRGAAYALAVLHCIGTRVLSPGSSATFGFLWYLLCFSVLAGSASALWSWRHPPQQAPLLNTEDSPSCSDGPRWDYERVAPYQPPC